MGSYFDFLVSRGSIIQRDYSKPYKSNELEWMESATSSSHRVDSAGSTPPTDDKTSKTTNSRPRNKRPRTQTTAECRKQTTFSARSKPGKKHTRDSSSTKTKTPNEMGSRCFWDIVKKEWPTGRASVWRVSNGSSVRVTQCSSFLIREHGMFASRLIQTASDYEGSRIIRCSEAYTSKQCGACGELNDKLGGSKTFNCQECGAVADRDVHAARNILLRCLQ